MGGRGKSMRRWLSLRLCGVLAAALALPLTASAGTIHDCGNQGGCAVTLSINGSQVASGTFSIDSSTGDLTFGPEPLTGSLTDQQTGSTSTPSVTDVHGNA